MRLNRSRFDIFVLVSYYSHENSWHFYWFVRLFCEWEHKTGFKLVPASQTNPICTSAQQSMIARNSCTAALLLSTTATRLDSQYPKRRFHICSIPKTWISSSKSVVKYTIFSDPILNFVLKNARNAHYYREFAYPLTRFLSEST